ncbi:MULTISPECIES: DUF948 domain-containing protein [Carnobacterium]|uniref:DUF948 domain-containing protein n=1 Tax=Carnobacterium divergens TaxID=2748 RepID=A0A2R8A2C8_CARDV|nr:MULTISPECIES: DUF948 domain-containing protein [Carnobacterium]MCO6017263.1 DUF948 domain-containing protein [Carnobacterium divergens]MDT1939322.1 DUF948 domain-containing protein [Carnobacterium divergens]MDT1941760.1 DUF948 domain-containing protein [Carnobacterium divergens]MDT1947558.1 DUF948 domain-containing protein [Carnobacterium divergens]MDT1949997.1 DUF948 domain-containing protein [Carnobacterium divergens]
MTGGEIAAIIAAVAFAVLVLFIVMAVMKITKIMEEISKTVKEANNSIEVITKDVDSLSIEVEGLLNKSNVLLDDVNGKLGMTDPLFQAIGDLGVTVSDLNQSSRNLAGHVTGATKKTAQASVISKIGRTAWSMNKNRKAKKVSKQSL